MKSSFYVAIFIALPVFLSGCARGGKQATNLKDATYDADVQPLQIPPDSKEIIKTPAKITEVR